MNKSLFRTLIKLAVVALCLTVVIRSIELDSVTSVLANLDWRYLIPPILMIWLEPYLSAKKWHVLMAHHGHIPPVGQLTRVLYTSNFLSLLSPTAIGADALRVWMLRQRGYRVFHTVSSMLMDRVMALCVLLGLVLAGWVSARAVLPEGVIRWVIPLVCLGVLFGVVLFYLPPVVKRYRCIKTALATWYRRDDHALRRWPRLHALGLKTGMTLDALFDAFQDYRDRPAALLQVIFWNLCLQGIRILQIHFLFLALRHPVPLIQEIAFVPLVIILVMLPISYFGIGIKEGAFVFLFTRVGVPSETCLAVSILTYPVILTGLIPGLFFFLSDRDTLSVKAIRKTMNPDASEAAVERPSS